MDYIKPLREFADRIFHVHAKDVRIDRDRLDDVGILATPLEYHTPKLPGLGEVDWGRFFSVLGDTGYEGRSVSRSKTGPTKVARFPQGVAAAKRSFPAQLLDVIGRTAGYRL